MKTISILFNIASLLILGYLIIDEGIPRGTNLGIFITFAGASISSLIYIFSHTGNSTSYLGLWLQRKKLEEQKKIDLLK
ncbi:hypothetical protein [Pseudomonas mandelii]|uniref:Group-specific protein n=1 Tax=Pseudomonas mandelii TaxID=75612 RepID=A0AB36CV87_9PSED|nr:hypothetical protein [Pseudomonas mandelii]NMZ78966.1 hypothetical protein [Pseudomonas mandelii]